MILVTGASGLLGQAVIQQLLDNNEQVVALINNTQPTLQHQNLITRKADILDIPALTDAMDGITQIYHCAAVVSFQKKDKQQLYKINVEGTANVVNVALEVGIKKLVHVSSVAALGRIRNDETVDENMYWTPSTSNSIYGETKYKGEMEVWRGMAEGLDAVIVNPSIIIGAANWNNSSTTIFKNVYDEFGWYSTGSTGWVDVHDVAKAMIALMHSDVTNQRFIVSGHNASYQLVFNWIADAFNKKRPTKKVTPILAAIVWRLEKIKSWFTGKKPLVTKETAATALTTVSYNNKKLLATIPSFQYTDLKTSITTICNQLLKLKN